MLTIQHMETINFTKVSIKLRQDGDVCIVHNKTGMEAVVGQNRLISWAIAQLKKELSGVKGENPALRKQ